MRKRQTKSVFAAALAGALMAAASPAIAHAQSPQNSDPKPLPSSILKAPVSAPLYNYKSGKVLQPSGGSTANGATIVQQPATGSSAQTWTLYYDNPYWSYENNHSGKNLGINGASTSAGAVAIQANPAGDHNQDWDVYASVFADAFVMQNRKSGLCLGISGASTANGAQAAQFPCDNTQNQAWTYVPR
ncbi:RICIN domain-containing protein [Streptomyces sp. WI04-05B]|uniref:RICIN domain-containing protein n=1 Tax=Streptomyces TaxID=1883 RepID=UPI0029A33339|nr:MULTISPECIES: RICIN domain-containing protein [unclassified Streptomyces]MDX2544976.1 RICIN domain-containing protein [Streptomyces sp. WI04-05B]MDX2589024.1 RICIN domain-containing protein [Streptomyces sp. WI04-05A]